MIEPRQHGYFKIHNANIYYRIYGTGEKTLFFLHGNGEDWTCFKRQIEFFPGSTRLLRWIAGDMDIQASARSH